MHYCNVNLYNCTVSNFLKPIAVITLIGQKLKFNAIILNFMDPKTIGQGPKFGPGAHDLDTPGIQFRLVS